MDGDVAVTQLAAEVRQVLLATTVDIEQRWQFLTPQDRVAAVSDVVFVAVLYNRLFADGVGALDALSSTFGKNLEDAATTADEAVLGIGLLTEDVVSLSDAVSRLVDYVRAQEDSVEVYDAVEVYPDPRLFRVRPGRRASDHGRRTGLRRHRDDQRRRG